MKVSPLIQPSRHAASQMSSKRMEWSRYGFGGGLLGYVVASAVFGHMPDDASLRAVWLAIGFAPALVGSCVGFTLAICSPD